MKMKSIQGRRSQGGQGGRSPPLFLEEFIHFDLKTAVFKVNFKVSPPQFFKA